MARKYDQLYDVAGASSELAAQAPPVAAFQPRRGATPEEHATVDNMHRQAIALRAEHHLTAFSEVIVDDLTRRTIATLVHIIQYSDTVLQELDDSLSEDALSRCNAAIAKALDIGSVGVLEIQALGKQAVIEILSEAVKASDVPEPRQLSLVRRLTRFVFGD